MKQSGGTAVSVDDDEIIEGMKLLARTEGIFAETAGGVTVAVAKKLAAQGVIDPDELVVVYVTGNGLKTQEALAGQLDSPVFVRATMASVEEALSLASLAASVA